MTTTDRVLETTTEDVRKRCDELEAENRELRDQLERANYNRESARLALKKVQFAPTLTAATECIRLILDSGVLSVR